MRPTIGRPVPNPARMIQRLGRNAPARYTVMLVGLGATGVAIGWLGPRLSPAAVTRRR
ncbi:hypothetical protein Acsp03_41490 [Actinomadura sp. NBRC 104412]|uniref:hypothetical protein n=1 Tax=unclassified Actinomadura TaxID=2626254 RepID=UPI00249FA082|nr:hypothetical protein [Actinomadura sp. NBRC 104412]GLZ06683.1 hypothetical protein Acsp03_41490 [Actinomadura sp. NBRC 104412]